MTSHPDLPLGACPICGRDLGRVFAVHGGFKVSCDPDRGGCGAEAALGLTYGEAVHWWNVGALRYTVSARALAAGAHRILNLAGVHHG